MALKNIRFGLNEPGKRPGRDRSSAGKVKLPVKRTVNLAVVDEKHINPGIAVPAIILIIIAAALFGKFAVADRLALLSEARAEQREQQRRVDAAYDQIASYGDLTDEYRHYTYEDFTESELTLADRLGLLELIDEKILPNAVLRSWAVSDNTLALEISGITLDEVSQLTELLQADERVQFCAVSTASTIDDDDGQKVYTSPYAEEEYEEADAGTGVTDDGVEVFTGLGTVSGSQIVEASVTVYLTPTGG